MTFVQKYLNCLCMESKQACKIFEALSSEIRLKAFRLLVSNAPDGLVAGDIAKLLNLPATNLSFHLKGLVQSGLVCVEREGRFMRYKASIPMMLDVIAYLTSECCSGKPECCRKFRKESGIDSIFLPDR